MILLNQKIHNILWSNLPSLANQWSSKITYKRNQMVVFKNHIYRNIVNSNQNVKPNLNTGKWLSFGVDNVHACIDLRSHTQTEMPDGLDYIELKIEATDINTLAFGAVTGRMLTIIEKDGNNNQLNSTNIPIGHERTCSNNWYSYYYCPIPDQGNLSIGQSMDVVHSPVDPRTAVIEITIEKNGKGKAGLGSLIGDQAKQLGETQFGTEIDLIDYSEKVQDKEGVTEIKHRDVQEITQCKINIPAKQTQIIKRQIKTSLGEVIMIIAEPEKDSNYENLITLGYIDRFTMRIDNGVLTSADMTIKESI